MPTPREDCECYQVPVQREVLLGLLDNPSIESRFFLTGGTALAVFYLHHRTSNDLDLFARGDVDLGEVQFWVTRNWADQAATLRRFPQILSMTIRATKVDFVIDPLSFDEPRCSVLFENGRSLALDTLRGIVSNKLCAAVNRSEPKDLLDLYFLLKEIPGASLDSVFEDARRKDAIFDDPPTAAYQIERNAAFLRENPALWPRLLRPANPHDVNKVLADVAAWLYGQLKS